MVKGFRRMNKSKLLRSYTQHSLKAAPGLHFNNIFLKCRPAKGLQLYTQKKRNQNTDVRNYPHLLHDLHNTAESNKIIAPFVERTLPHFVCMHLDIAVVISL